MAEASLHAALGTRTSQHLRRAQPVTCRSHRCPVPRNVPAAVHAQSLAECLHYIILKFKILGRAVCRLRKKVRVVCSHPWMHAASISYQSAGNRRCQTSGVEDYVKYSTAAKTLQRLVLLLRVVSKRGTRQGHASVGYPGFSEFVAQEEAYWESRMEVWWRDYDC